MSATRFNSDSMAREMDGRRILKSTPLNIWRWRLRAWRPTMIMLIWLNLTTPLKFDRISPTLANSEWGQQFASPDDVASQISSCSATGFTVTYTATATTTSTTASATSYSRCNITDSDVEVVTTTDDDTCVAISQTFNVSTPGLISQNALDLSCFSITGNMTLCLPSVCEIYLVTANDIATLSWAILPDKSP